MTNPHTYTTFGLTIASEMELPELLPAEGPAQVRVAYGPVPESLEEPDATGLFFQIKGDRHLINLQKVVRARFLVQDGNRITIQRLEEGHDESIRLYLLGSCMRGLLYQRDLLPMHGSAIATDDGALVFAGGSGAGKSTLAALFHQRGYQLLSDDICALQVGPDGQARVLPGYPRLKLWADTTRKLEIDQQFPVWQ